MDKNNIKVSSVDMEERAKLGIRAGDTVRVWIKIEEKGKTRLQAFEGLVLAVKHGSEAGGMFTVRKVASGVGVEKIFPLYSPTIDKIEIVKRAKMRRAKLYFLRDKVAREVKRALRRSKLMGISTKGLTELEDERKRAEAAELKRQEEESAREAQEVQNDAETADNEEATANSNDDIKKDEASVNDDDKEESEAQIETPIEEKDVVDKKD